MNTSRHALVFDPSYELAATIRDALEVLGYQAVVARNQFDAEKLIDGTPHVSLFVAHASFAQEWDLTHTLVFSAADRNMAVVAIASMPLHEAGSIPATAIFLGKPFGQDQLKEAILAAVATSPVTERIPAG